MKLSDLQSGHATFEQMGIAPVEAAEGSKVEQKSTLRLVEELEAPKTVEAAEALASQEDLTPTEEKQLSNVDELAVHAPEAAQKVAQSKEMAVAQLTRSKEKKKKGIKEVIGDKTTEAETQSREKQGESDSTESIKSQLEALKAKLIKTFGNERKGLEDQISKQERRLARRLRSLNTTEEAAEPAPVVEESVSKSEVEKPRPSEDSVETERQRIMSKIKELEEVKDRTMDDDTYLASWKKKLKDYNASHPEEAGHAQGKIEERSEGRISEVRELKSEVTETKAPPVVEKTKKVQSRKEEPAVNEEDLEQKEHRDYLLKMIDLVKDEDKRVLIQEHMDEKSVRIRLTALMDYIENFVKGRPSNPKSWSEENKAYFDKAMGRIVEEITINESQKKENFGGIHVEPRVARTLRKAEELVATEPEEVLGAEDIISEIKTSAREDTPKTPESFSKKDWDLLVTHMNDPEIGKEIWEVLPGMRRVINEIKDLEDGLGNVEAYDKEELKAAKERRMASLKNKIKEKRDELQSFQPKFQELVAKCRAMDQVKEETTPEIKTSVMAETIKQPESEMAAAVIESDVKTLRGMGKYLAEAPVPSKTMRGVAPEAAPAVPETAPVEKVKTAKAEPKIEPVVKAKEKSAEPVKSKVEARPSPAKIVFEGKTEDLIKEAAKSESEQRKNGLEARLSEIKNLPVNEWSETYAEPGGFNQALWDQLSSEKGNEAKSEKERFKELRYNAVDYDLKEMETNDNLGKKRRRLANYARELADKSLSEDKRDELQDKVSDLKRREATILLELKGIEDLRKKDEAEEMELLGRAQKRLPSVPKTPDSATALKPTVVAPLAPEEFEEEENLVARMYEIDDKIKDIKKEMQSNRRHLRLGIREESFENTENIEDYMKSQKVVGELEEQLAKLEEEKKALMGKGAPAEAEAAKTKNKSTSKAGRIAKKIAIGTGIGAGGLLVGAGAAIARFQYWARWQAPLAMLEWLMKFTGDPGGTFKKGVDWLEKADPMKLLGKNKTEKTGKE